MHAEPTSRLQQCVTHYNSNCMLPACVSTCLNPLHTPHDQKKRTPNPHSKVWGHHAASNASLNCALPFTTRLHCEAFEDYPPPHKNTESPHPSSSRHKQKSATRTESPCSLQRLSQWCFALHSPLPAIPRLLQPPTAAPHTLPRSNISSSSRRRMRTQAARLWKGLVWLLGKCNRSRV